MKTTTLAAASGVSALGDTLAVVALMLALQDRPGGSFAVSALVLLGLLPSVLLGPLVAPLLDRFETTRILAITLVLRCLIGVLLAYAGDLPWMLVLIAAGNVVSAVDSPAMTLLVPATMRPGANPAVGYARMDAARSVGTLVGPAIAGLAVGVIGTQGALLVDAATFGVLAAVIVGMRVRRHSPMERSAERPSWFAQVAAGPAALRRSPTIATAVVALAAAIVFTSMITVAEVEYARDILDAPAVVYGALVSAQACGRLLCAAVVAPRIPVCLQPSALAAGSALMGVALLVMGLLPATPVAFAGLFVVGLANALQSIAIRAIVVTSVDEDQRGRAFAAVIALNNGSTMLGTAAAGPLVAVFGAATALAVSGIGTLVAAIPAVRHVRAWRGRTDATSEEAQIDR
ncbi:MFS transporter [Leifsonia virtsii]|uniref:MFS transporter n=1 Tax=Leifsonia virtsii TaxID=3035915 RepID=A0ABT8IYI4_9MICO|nr:MFS transporter [Leifsonia virtsii]MDN4597089.1 MFS transporter [Leifsonia virtsii]